MSMAKYVAIPLLGILASCASPKTHIESNLTLDKQPTYESKELKQDVKGKSDKSRDEQEKDAKDMTKIVMAELNKPSNDPYSVKDFEFSTDKGGYTLKAHSESGWLPEKYVKMLNEARDKGYFLSYGFYADGASSNENTVVKRPVIVMRKTNGLYDIGIYENKDDANMADCINFIKYNDAESLGKAIQNTDGVARTNWPKLKRKDGKIVKNPRVHIRTNKGIKEIVTPYAIQMKEKTIIVIDEELKRCLKDDELPKYYEVLKE